MMNHSMLEIKKNFNESIKMKDRELIVNKNHHIDFVIVFSSLKTFNEELDRAPRRWS